MDDARSYWLNPEQNHLFERITYHQSAAAALRGSDAVYISTDWEEFRNLAQVIRQTVKPPYLIIDGRRMIADFAELVAAGFDFLAVGGATREGVGADGEPAAAAA